MNMITYRAISIGLLALILVGCSQMPTQLSSNQSARSQTDQINERLRTGNQAAADCQRVNRDTPAGKIVFSTIIIASSDQPNKLDLLASKARLNEVQKKALREFVTASSRCRDIRFEANRGLPSLAILSKDAADKDVLYSRLLAGQILIGEFNISLREVNLSTAEAFRKLNETSRNARAPEPVQPARVQQPSNNSSPMDSFLRGIRDANSFAQPPPPMQIITPGTTRSNNNYTLPGQFNQQNDINCTTTRSGNQSYTNCR